MFIFYTILYLVLLYFSYFFAIILPHQAFIFSAIRECYFAYLFFLCLYKILIVKQAKIVFSYFTKLMCFILFLAVPYIFISNYLNYAMITFFLYFSGPILFLLISNLSFSKKTIEHFNFWFNLIMSGICFLNILFYFVQDNLISLIPTESLSFFSRQEGKLRYLGIAFHPTCTGFFFVYFIGYIFIVKRNLIASLFNGIFFLFTGTRSAIFGVPFYIFLKFKKHTKIFAFILGAVLLALVYMLLTKNMLNMYLDGSAIAHLFHLFVLGPETIIKYPWGAGLGTVSPYNQESPIIHLESEAYLYCIQLGFFNFILKIVLYYHIVRKLLTVNSRMSNYLVFLLFTFLAGCLVFGLNDIRFVSNFVWVMLGIEFSKCEYHRILPAKGKFYKWRRLCLALR